MNTERDVFQDLADKWGAPVVARTHVSKFSGGILNAKTMANMDACGVGVGLGKIRIGRKVAYRTDALIEWMRKRAN